MLPWEGALLREQFLGILAIITRGCVTLASGGCQPPGRLFYRGVDTPRSPRRNRGVDTPRSPQSNGIPLSFTFISLVFVYMT
jgi:hypothetical protein